MAKTVDYYFFTISPFAYLGHRVFERILRERGATAGVKPVSVRTVFAETGGVPPAKRHPSRRAYRFVELGRWARERDLPLVQEPAYFPVDDTLSACAIYAAEEQGGDPLGLAHAVLRACWAEERDVSDGATLHALARETGHDADTLLARAESAPLRQKLEQTTCEAIDRGVFGAPWYLVDGEAFWGQDRLDFVDRKLAAAGGA